MLRSKPKSVWFKVGRLMGEHRENVNFRGEMGLT